MVPQEVLLFGGSIAETIAYGNSPQPKARVICSSSVRFIFPEDCKPCLLRQDTAEGAGLAQATSLLICR